MIIRDAVDSMLIESTKAIIADEIRSGIGDLTLTIVQRLEQRLAKFAPTPYFDYAVMMGQASAGEQTIDVAVKFAVNARFYYIPTVIHYD